MWEIRIDRNQGNYNFQRGDEVILQSRNVEITLLPFPYFFSYSPSHFPPFPASFASKSHPTHEKETLFEKRGMDPPAGEEGRRFWEKNWGRGWLIFYDKGKKSIKARINAPFCFKRVFLCHAGSFLDLVWGLKNCGGRLASWVGEIWILWILGFIPRPPSRYEEEGYKPGFPTMSSSRFCHAAGLLAPVWKKWGYTTWAGETGNERNPSTTVLRISIKKRVFFFIFSFLKTYIHFSLSLAPLQKPSFLPPLSNTSLSLGYGIY